MFHDDNINLNLKHGFCILKTLNTGLSKSAKVREPQYGSQIDWSGSMGHGAGF